mmetsp:Transcript_153501/g.270910  ORF Transcript_153501/g.270910 Transcript_153501/m.270910 type:complete len:285 (+) Transcript_153501:87-941(+)
MAQSVLLGQQPLPYAGEKGRARESAKFPAQKASSPNQRPMMLSLETLLTSTATQQMKALPPLMCADQSTIEQQDSEVGSMAWAQAVKFAAQTGSESTTGSLGSDNIDARTEDSSFELDSPHTQAVHLLDSPHTQAMHQSGSWDSISASAKLFPHAVPVRHTFVHFDVNTNMTQLRRSQSAPEIMCKSPFRRIRNPEMEELHFKGECRPCAYFYQKADGCRWGTECTFCHLCPREAAKAKRKERVKAMKRELYEQGQMSKQQQQPPSAYWRLRKHAAKLSRSKAD